ncbi:CubicO group peptidase (beta-lactamase class C family) [Streptomyces sp. 3330]|uniref:serine hydrolase domain-containing protein n=1 Tax=Streptomyces sp. 3330 TaxID=2817755 RepID=UPI002858FDE6|nr:serine hydrolase domain-containing protein [Streptomyces sp. 3330]MDR6980785.1 CubicO group peptidase (beta-lactamase class C family) [Streptomyces sp. 3330]
MAARASRRAVLGLLGVAPAGALLAGVPVPAAADDRSGPVPTGLLPGGELDQYAAGKADEDEFSGSMLLTHRGRTVLARSYGMADQQRAIANGPGTLFALASVTKLFTAVAVAQLAQQRKVTYDAPLGRYLDGFPSSVTDSVTVHHLLTHTSGLGDFHALPDYDAAQAGWTTREQTMNGIRDLVRQTEPDFAPGAGWLYSNSGYFLLGAIVEKVTGMSYYDYVQRYVFDAAGMTDTRFLTQAEWQAGRNIAHPYHRAAQGQWTDGISEARHIVGDPAGDAFTSCADLDRFGRLLWRRKLLDPGHTALTLSGKVPLPGAGTTPADGTSVPAQAMFQCYGPMGALVAGQWVFGHGGGSTIGVSTSIDVYPETDWGVVVLSNYEGRTAQLISALARKLITAGE